MPERTGEALMARLIKLAGERGADILGEAVVRELWVDVQDRILGVGYQRPDGTWIPLWFGNQNEPAEENPTYGTARVVIALAKLGHPEQKLPPVIHVAGTNGKGSTVALMRAMLEAAGKSVHVYTSPHLVRFHERIRLGQKGRGRLVTEQELVDAFARYRITDPLRFYQSVNSVAGANIRLTSIVNSTVRTILADASLSTVVRADRAGLMHRIRDDVNEQSKGLGIQIVDVRLRRADLPEQNSQAVFQRMQTERQREAADIRAQGSQFSQAIKAKADRDVVVLRAEATRKSEQVRGEALDARVDVAIEDAAPGFVLLLGQGGPFAK